MLHKASAVILASGAGTRLGEITRDTPKPLLEFQGKPFLGHLIGWLLTSGIRDVVVTTHTHHQQIEGFIDTQYGTEGPVRWVREPALVSTIASARAGLEQVANETSFLLTADNIWDANLANMHANHLDRRAAATTLLTARPGVPNAGRVAVGPDDRVLEMWPAEGQEPRTGPDITNASTMGLYLVERSQLLGSIEAGDSSIEREPMNRLIPRVYAHWSEGVFFDYGTPANYQALRDDPSLLNYFSA